MRRILTIIIAVVILFSLTITAYAETEGSTTITTTVVSNPPTWNLSIPADIDIPYQQEKTEIGEVQITDINNPDKHQGWVDIYLTYDNLKNGDNTILLEIDGAFFDSTINSDRTNQWKSGEKFPYIRSTGSKAHDHNAYFGDSNSSYPITITSSIQSGSWENAKPGTYSTTLTFTAQYGGYGVNWGI